MQLETYNYCLNTTHHAKQCFDWTMWVVTVNTHFSIVSFSCFITCTGRMGGWIKFDDLYVI